MAPVCHIFSQHLLAASNSFAQTASKAHTRKHHASPLMWMDCRHSHASQSAIVVFYFVLILVCGLYSLLLLPFSAIIGQPEFVGDRQLFCSDC